MATLLLFTVLLPLFVAGYLFASPGLPMGQARKVALGAALATLALSLILILAFRPGAAGPQFVVGSIDRPGIQFTLGLDGISLYLFGLTSLLMITAIFSSWESVTERPAMHYAFLLSLQTGLLGLFASLDVVLFYIFFEFTLIPLFFLIGLWGGEDRRRASVTFFLYTLAGSLLTLVGAIALVVIHQQHSPQHVLTFSIPALTNGLATLPWDQWSLDWSRSHPWSASPQVMVFLLLFAGFAVKVPMFPFHTWLPLAHVQAPAAGSILLAGVLLKVGSYGLLRFNLGMCPHGATVLFPYIATLAVIGIIYGALAALAQTDIKKLVAYSSVSHMGFIVLGLFALNRTGIEGASIQMLNHGLTTGALFACVGVIYERYHTREMSELGGLWERMPLFAFFLILASMGSAALPGLNGFVGEFPILTGMFAKSPEAASIAALGMILGGYYLLWMLQRVLFGPLKEPHSHAPGHGHETVPVRPLGWHEIAGLTPLMVLIVGMGVFPAPFFARIAPAVRPVVQRLDPSQSPDPSSQSTTKSVAQIAPEGRRVP